MDKTAKKELSVAALAAAAIALLAFVAVAYAQGDDRNHEQRHAGEKGMMDMMGGNEMDELHKQMTRNLDPPSREQMDKMHEMCEKSPEGNGDMMEGGMMQ
ncbi:TPA: hypothetical protein HA372_02585 [Candidatus Woesearchaeota archaeon]|nr:MAG: hypothetical protein QT04_C0057G0020 [archaeon GW2011_AR11]HIJ18554.1 hypothetical protein [Candidatus Woesearchaeota archaeon]